MLLLFGAFFAGIITVLAPCVLPLLPIIIGGSISGNVEDKKRPFIIAGSLAVSLIVFTVLLKATTLFINVPPEFFVYVSGAILIGLGIVFLFPNLYEKFLLKFNLQAKGQQLLGGATGKGPLVSAILTGAALGPVFSSCSPVYAYIIATVLPVDFGTAMIAMIAYVTGLSLMLLLIGFVGQRFVKKLRFAMNPRGWFNRTLAIIFIIVGILVITGFDKKLQTYVSENTPFDFDALSAQLIPGESLKTNNEVLNVEPYKAPEFEGLENWINSEPKQLSDYEGKVVLIDFWTYSCINCIRTQPYLKAWYETYKDSGFEIVGVHAPEFAFERDPANVKRAADKAGLTYPIALDNDFATWNAYNNQFWPATYLIDKEGNVRRFHAGEGEYQKGEDAIRALLRENGGSVPNETSSMYEKNDNQSGDITPETYLGTKRASNFTSTKSLTQGTAEYPKGASLDRINAWTLGGLWQVSSEGVMAKENSTLTFRFKAKDMFVVTANNVDAKDIEVLIDGKPISETPYAGSDVKNSKVSVSKAQLYRLVEADKLLDDATLELRVPNGIQLNVFTFG